MVLNELRSRLTKGVWRLRRALANRIEPREAKPDPKWDIPIDLSLKGASALRTLLAVDEDSYLTVAGQSWGDPRAYVLYTALDEVKKTAMYLVRLRDLLQGPELVPSEDRITRLLVTHLAEEQHARIRRLLEVLVLLILFDDTNDQEYYRHLLLLEELDDMVSANADLKEFYGVRSANIDESIEHQVEWIRQVEPKIDISRCWYLAVRAPIGDPTSLRPGRTLSSIRSRVRAAMPAMTAGEKLLFGYSYGGMYGHASEAVHYSVNRRDFRLRPGEEISAVGSLGLLNFHVLDRCHRLLGMPEVPVATQLNDVLKRSHAGRLLHLATVRDISVGDFVLAYGDLAEVIEVEESRYAYRSYRVRYIAEKPKPTIQEDWFPARYVQCLYTKEQFLQGMERLVQVGKLPPDIAAKMGSLSPAELQPLLRESIATAWKLGLRDWVHRGKSS
jgi:hypothetical protein